MCVMRHLRASRNDLEENSISVSRSTITVLPVIAVKNCSKEQSNGILYYLKERVNVNIIF